MLKKLVNLINQDINRREEKKELASGSVVVEHLEARHMFNLVEQVQAYINTIKNKNFYLIDKQFLFAQNTYHCIITYDTEPDSEELIELENLGEENTTQQLLE